MRKRTKVDRWAKLGASAGLIMATSLWAGPASAHDLHLAVETLQQGVHRIWLTINHLRASPPLPLPPITPKEQRRVLGAAEVELKVGNTDRALRMLLGRLMDPDFKQLPEYVDTLLLASEILEDRGEVDGAMSFSRQALEQGGEPTKMAEAGARWFRLSRRHQRLDDRLEVFALWERAGGLAAASEEMAAQARYEAAFALRDESRFDAAQRLLARVPSTTAYGSRAAYLAGVLHVQAGDLASAERWFTALMRWPLPDLPADHPRVPIETEVRAMAALAAGRLLYERGEHSEARQAYALVPDESRVKDDACFEQVYLAVEDERQRAGLRHLRCVLDLGVGGGRSVDARLLQASLYAHLARYDEAIASYERAHNSFVEERKLVGAALEQIKDPARFLFEGMERNSIDQGPDASPGPALVFADAWTPEVDRAYRLDRDILFAEDEVHQLRKEIDRLIAHLSQPNPFPALEMRQEHLQRVLRDIQHLQGHASDTQMAIRQHASAEPSLPSDHDTEAALTQKLVTLLDQYATAVEGDILALDREKAKRQKAALSTLGEIRSELVELESIARSIDVDAEPPIQAAAKAAFAQILSTLDRATMRAEVGVLDSYWIAKEHVSRKIRNLAMEKETLDEQVSTALAETSDLGL